MLTIAEALRQGVDLHKRGQLDNAERLYRQVLDADARNGDAWHLLGLVSQARGDSATAVEYISRAIEIDPRQPSFHNHLAEMYRGQGRLAEAEQSCRTALALKEDFAPAHNTLGLVLNRQGRLEEAVDCFRRAVALDPKFALAYANLASTLHALVRLDEAIDCFRRALAIDPNHAQAHCDLGSALDDLGRRAEAADCFRRAVQCNPNLAEAHFNLGVLLQNEGRTADASQCYENAIRAKPDYAMAYNNLGILHRPSDPARADECYTKALELDPSCADALNNLGNLRIAQGRLAEAATCYERAVRIRPDYAKAHYNSALLLLAEGNFPAGWREFEWRSGCREFPPRSFDQPRWQGEPLANRTLLVHAEQGLGDTMQFARYLPLVAERGGTITFEVQSPLVPLLKQSGFGEIAKLVARSQPPGKFDLHLPMLSLPGVFATTLDNIPAAGGGYLSADRQWIEHWRGVLGDAPTVKVGIAWQGSTAYQQDRVRSIPLVRFAPLALEGVELISLQKGFGAEQLADVAPRFLVRDLGTEFDEAHGAFVDTAAVMRNLDLVITSDTAIAHLAGALGVPVWVALPLVPDWRWMFERSDCPWYASMRLFRQTRLDDWAGVFDQIAVELGRFVAR
jgi:tetratricopeptide (TPR) repeat protein